MPETHTQFPQKLNVRAGIMGDRMLEPVIVEGLQENLMPALAALFPNPLDPDLPDKRKKTISTRRSSTPLAVHCHMNRVF
jgi:hypothetical protein